MWKFRELMRGEPERDPHEAEFFNVGDLDASSSLVREVIQNSLDAKISSEVPVQVKFLFGKYESNHDDDYYRDLIPHLQSCEFLKENLQMHKCVPFIVIEDFNTTGLDGVITRDDVGDRSSISNYYNFWWREGKSNKGGTKAGRWGLGKVVFNVVSQLRSFWGLTIRKDDKQEILLGKAVLKTHIHNKKRYNYYGYFAQNDNIEPISSTKALKEFHQKFGLSRKKEPGLSVVIPLPMEEIKPFKVIRATVIHYFFPIIKGDLIVEVDWKDNHTILNNMTLPQIAKAVQDWGDSAWEDCQIEALLRFVNEATKTEERDMIFLQHPSDKLKMSGDLFGAELERAIEKYASGGFLAIRVPITIRPQNEQIAESYFDAFIQKDESLNHSEEFYIRSGITISGIAMLRQKKARTLLYANDEAISKFLGDSESPAHTDWKERTENFKKMYERAVETLRYIRSGLREIVVILDQPPEGIEHDFLKDFFFVYEEAEGEKKRISRTPKVELEKKRAKFGVSQLQSGFRIRLSDDKMSLPIGVLVRVAYDIRRGNPFKRYHIYDFDLASKKVKKDLRGGTFTSIENNIIKLKIESTDFELKVFGFDDKRDVIIDIQEE